MKPLTYRTRNRLRRVGTFVGYLLLFVLLVGVCWFVWLERFVVYNSEGAQLVFDYVSPEGEVQVAVPPEEETVFIYYNEGQDFVNTSTELTQIMGYYATTDMLVGNIEGVKSVVSQLPAGSAVMLDVKNIYGSFYYSSKLPDATIASSVDVDQVDELIETLDQSGAYLIARVPAFRERAYALEYTNHGLSHSSGGYLWYDEQNCYWLNPASTGTVNWLVSIANELRSIGFDEVVFTDFKFPDTTDILYESTMSQQEALDAAAQTLMSNCATNRFAISFESADPGFQLPEGRSRLYLTGVDAAQVAEAAAAVTVPDPAVNLVFLTETNDTRFDVYSAMRPMPVSTQ